MNGDQFLADHELKDAVGIDVGEYIAQLRWDRETFEELAHKIMVEGAEGVGKIQPADGEVALLEFGLLDGLLQKQGVFLDSRNPRKEVFLLG